MRGRVLRAIEELNYQPSGVARSLRRKRTHTIGMIIPDNTNPFFAEVARGIEDASFELGYNVILCNSDGDLEKEMDYLGLLIEKRVDGLVFVSAGSNQ
ncbi:MAG: LacI family DNA-binding transcriptional regulator, partial [Anaerolineae bacterium]|nr:LacI family DNA-binding transcriptional regulator [Anaerolineae bacterium]